MASESPFGGNSSWRRESAKQRRRRSVQRNALRRRRGLFESLETRWLMAKDLNVRFEFTDLSNNPLTSLQVGQDIQLRVWVQDIRTSPQGVFQAYLDVNYNSSLISPTGPIVHGSDFGNAGTTSGNLTTPGLIDEVGSRDFDQVKPIDTAAEELLFSVPFQVNAAGNLTITADLADVPTNKILFFDTVTGVPLSDIQFQGGTASISAGPMVSSITKADPDPTTASQVNYTVTFDKNVTGVDTGDFALASTVTGASIASVTPVSDSVYTVTVNTGSGDGTIGLNVVDNDTIRDSTNQPLGGPGTGNGNFTGPIYTIDRTGPTVTINQAAAQADPTSNTTINFTVIFSEAVTNFATGDVTLGGTAGATTALVTGSGTTYNVAVSGMTGPGTVIASLAGGVASDAAGNPSAASTSTDNSVTFDTQAPTVTINQAASQSDPTNQSPINFTVVFSEPVTGFGASDIFFGGTAPGALLAVVTGSGTTYNVAVSGMSGAGTVTASVVAGAAVDGANNPSAASTSTDNSVTYDNVQPTVTINQAAGQSDPTGASPINFTVVFSEPVTGFETGDITLGGTAGATTAIVTGSGTTYNVAVSGMTGPGTVAATIGAGVANDTAGNANQASSSTDNTVTFDNAAPTVTINQAAAQSDPTNSATINFTVVFSEPVTGFTNSDLALSGTAGGTLSAVVTGSGATYNVAVSGMTSPGTVIASVIAGAAVDTANNPSAASTSTDNSVTFDNVQPTVTINQAAAQNDPTNQSPINFTVVFSEPVTGFTSAEVALSGTAPGTLVATVTGSGTTYNVAVSGMTASGTVVAAINAGVANDAAGNGNSASTSTDNSVNYDVVGPTVTINQAAAQADPTNSSPINFTVVFSEPVTNFTTGDVTLGGTAGATTAIVTGSGTTYNVAVSGMTSPGTVIASINAGTASDAAGNANSASTSTDNSVTFDNTQPTVTINQAAAQADPTNGATINFTVVFSEPVANFATGDVTLSGTAGATTAIVTGSGTTYNVAVSGMTGPGTVIASINAGVASDAAGNANQASTSTDNSVTFDNTQPTVTINQAAGQADPTSGTTINFTVVFSEPVTNFATGDVTLSGTAGATTAIVTGSGATYNVAVSGMTTSGTVIANISAGVANDTAGNANQASTSTDNSVTFDTAAPTVTINQASGQSDPTNGSPINFTVVFSEPVTGFTAGDLSLGGTAPGTLVAVVTGSGTTYNVAVSGMTGSGTVTASVNAGAANDAAGNPSTASTSTDNSVTYDVTVPTVTINQATSQADPTNTSPINFTVVFSEAVDNFTGADVTLSGTAPGTLVANVTGSGTTYNVAVSGMTGSGTVIASLGPNVATETAGNGNAASTSTDNVVTYDLTSPTVVINQAIDQADPTNGSTINFTVIFSEPVSNFTTGDVTLGGTAGATTAIVTGSGTTYNVAVSGMTVSGTVIASIAAGVATDASSNANLASTSSDNTVNYDIVSPTVTINLAAGQTDPSPNSPLNFTVVFSEPVTGFTSSDVQLSGTAPGALTAVVTGSGTTYNVAVSGMTNNGTVTASIAAGAANDAAGNPSEASTSTANTVNYTGGTLTPVVTSIVRAGGNPTNFANVVFTVTFNTAVTGVDATDFELTTSGLSGASVANVTGSGASYTVTVNTGTGDGTVRLDVVDDDTILNIASVPLGGTETGNGDFDTGEAYTIDKTAPTVAINQASGQSDPTNQSPINFTVVFSENVTGFGPSDISIGGTAPDTLTAIVTGSGTTYNVAISGMTGSGTVTASVVAGAASDAAGNSSAASTSTDNSVTYDVTAPTVTINQASGQDDPTNDSPINFTVVFSEVVTGFDSGDVQLGGTAGGTLTAIVTGSGTTYNVAVSGMTGNGTVTASVVANAAVDGAGNNSVASTSTDNSVTFDTTGPTVTINQAAGQSDPTNASIINFTVVFSEPVTGFTNGDITLGGGAGATTAVVTGSGTTYNVAVSGMTGPGTVIASINASVASDAAGNPNAASTSTDNSVTFDSTPITVTINQATGQDDPTNDSPINFTVIFSEAVSNFATGDVTLSGTAGATTVVITGSGTTYNVAVSGMTSGGTVIASINAGVVSDEAGNQNLASSSDDNSVTFDNTAPTVTINQAAGQSDPAATSPVNFTVIFSEPVTGFTSSDVLLSGTAGATTAVVTGTGTTYNVAVSGMTTTGTVIATVAAGAATDSAGNASAASTSTDNSVVFDRVPTVDANGPYTVAEGGLAQITGTGTDPGDSLTFAWDLDGDGTFGETGSAAARGNETGATPTFNAANLSGPATATIALRVSDAGGTSATDTALVTVTNAVPTANAGGPYTVNEGATVGLQGTGSDQVDAITLAWDLDGDGTFGETGSAAARGNETGAAPVFNAAGVSGTTTSTATLRVTDADGASATATALVTINNVAPTANAGGPYTVNEGATVGLTGTGSDPVDALTLTWDLDGDGTFGETGSAAGRGNESGASPVFNASSLSGPATSTVTLRVTDANGASTTATALVNVLNLPPTANAGGPYTVNEGATVGLTGTGSDPVDALTLTWDLDGDGAFGETGSAATRGNETGATPLFNATGINGPATRSVTLRVTDANGASATSTALINVVASQPTANAGGPYTVNEGATTQLTGTGTDPSGGALTLAWDLDGDGAFGETGSAAARGNETSATPTFNASGVNGPSTATVTLRVTDSGGSSVTATAIVNVSNVTPTAEAGGPYTVSSGGTVTLTGSGTDPVDTVTLTWDLDGDGSFGETGSAAARGNETGNSPIFNAAGLSSGSANTVTLRVTDASGAQNTDTAVVTVSTPSLTIPNVSIDEGNTGTKNMVFTVTLSSPSTSVVTVQFATGGGTATAGTDYTATSGTLTFQPGTTSQTITVVVTGDTTDEPNETFNVTLTNASGATLPSAALGTINDDDPTASQPNTARIGPNPTNPGTQALIIEGTDGNDNIKVKRHRQSVVVIINGVNKGSFPISSVPQLVIYGLAGNDKITVSRRLSLSAYINGNDGDDIIKGTRRPDLLMGGGGNDKIKGRKGNDVIIAGTGADTVRAGKGQDLIITGSTTHDANEEAVGDLLQMWSNPTAEYDTRLNTIRTATSPLPALTTQTVLDDAAVDQAFGQSGRDWYWGNTTTDRMRVRTKKNEVVN